LVVEKLMKLGKIAVWTTIFLLPTTALFAQSLDQVLGRIKQKNAMSIGYRESSLPFSYLDDDRKPVGYAMDLCAKVVEDVKKKLQTANLAVNYVAVNPQNRIPLVANGTVDLECGSTVNTLSRQEQVDFSAAYFIATTRLLVKTNSGVKDVEDLNGKSIALPINTTPERLIQKIIEEKKMNVRIVPVKDNTEGFLALSTGRVDAFSTDDIILYGLRKSAPVPTDYEVVGQPRSFDPYGLMIQKNNTVFLTLINTTLARLFRSGEAKALYTKWFAPIDAPLSADLEADFKMQGIPE
jgi:glutamate/aspartate transport system substrate-binding protein